MIVKLLMDLLKFLLLFVISLFPALPDMSGLIQSLDSVLSVLKSINFVVSVSLVGWCVSFLFIFSNIEFIWSIIMWVVRKIPGVS